MPWDRTAGPHNTGAVGQAHCVQVRGKRKATGPSKSREKLLGRGVREEQWAFDKIHQRERISLSITFGKAPAISKKPFLCEKISNMQKSCKKYPKNSQEHTHYPESPVVNILHIYFIIVFLTTSSLYNFFPYLRASCRHDATLPQNTLAWIS